MKQRSFVMKYQSWYSNYNHGKSGAQNKANRRLGKKQMRNRLKREVNVGLKGDILCHLDI